MEWTTWLRDYSIDFVRNEEWCCRFDEENKRMIAFPMVVCDYSSENIQQKKSGMSLCDNQANEGEIQPLVVPVLGEDDTLVQ